MNTEDDLEGVFVFLGVIDRFDLEIVKDGASYTYRN
jgi:hypothetical protein